MIRATLLVVPLLLIPGLPGLVAAEGGENIQTATVIPGLRYEDSGTTCGHVDDYDAACPTTSSSPDVVYSYRPISDVVVTVDLCNSSYNSKVYVYDGDESNLVACDDDGCYIEGQARITHLAMVGGHTYYIVVDGSNGACGPYNLLVQAEEPCVVPCPAGAQQEGEPPCQDGYEDHYDGGCFGGGWIQVEAQTGGCADLCGKACTYVYAGQNYRDTDWYVSRAAGGVVTVTVEGEFAPDVLLFYVPQCAPALYQEAWGLPCQPVSVSRSFSEGQEFWVMIAPFAFFGVPPSNYHLHICGIEGTPTPVGRSTWGRIKSTYREGGSKRSSP